MNAQEEMPEIPNDEDYDSEASKYGTKAKSTSTKS